MIAERPPLTSCGCHSCSSMWLMWLWSAPHIFFFFSLSQFFPSRSCFHHHLFCTVQTVSLHVRDPCIFSQQTSLLFAKCACWWSSCRLIPGLDPQLPICPPGMDTQPVPSLWWLAVMTQSTMSRFPNYFAADHFSHGSDLIASKKRDRGTQSSRQRCGRGRH